MAITSRFGRSNRSSSDASSLAPPKPTTAAAINLPSDKGVTPYLGLRSRLSQVWINRWTVLLFLVLARMLIAVANLNDEIRHAKSEALAACNSVQAVGSALASTPHYLAQGVNSLTADGIEKSVHALMSTLHLIVTAVEEIVVFYINTITGTYMCLITFAVGGSLHVAVDLLEDVSGFLNNSLHSIGQDIVKGEDDFNTALNKVISGLNDVGNFFGSKTSVPTLDLSPQVSRLNNLQLPQGYTTDLNKLNNSIPNYDQVKNFTDNTIRLPFEEIKKLINASLPNYQFNHSMFPTPAKKQLEFCSQNAGLTKFFDHLIDLETTARIIAIVVLVAIAVLICGPMAWREVRHYRFQQWRARIVGTNQHEPMDVVYLTSRPYTSSAGMWLSSRIKSHRLKSLVRWVVAYATTPPALVVLSLGVAGLLSCLVQWILLRIVVKEVPALYHEVTAFADEVIYSLQNTSAEWANDTNHVILTTNNAVNHDVLGWVNTSTEALNKTLNVFTDEMMKALNATFGGTVLYTPILEVYNCLIGLKVAGIEKALTWVHDHAHIDFPLLPNDTFSKGVNQSLNDGSLNSPDTDLTGAVTGVLVKVVEKTENGIRNEAIIAGTLVAVYFIVLYMGIARASWLAATGKQEAVSYVNDVPMGPTNNGDGYPSEKQIVQENVTAAPTGRPPVPPPVPQSDPFADPTNVRTMGNAANQYNGVPYTLDPTPYSGRPRSPKLPQVGYAGARDVNDGLTRPTSDRRSHYPEVGGT